MSHSIYNPSRDSYIDKILSTTNFGSATTLQLRQTVTDQKTILISFLVSDIDDSSIITAANLSLHVPSITTVDCDWQIHRLVRTAWLEAQATWIVYRTGISWTTAGANHVGDDIDATDPDTFTGTMPSGTVGWYSFGDVLANVVNGIDDFGGGVHLRIAQTVNQNGQTFSFRSNDDPSTDEGILLRPKLTLTVPNVDTGGGYAAMSHANLVTPKII